MLLRLLSLAVVTFALTACGGGGGGYSSANPFNPNPFAGAQCDPGTAVQLANPQPGQTVSPTMGSVTIVASGNNNTLYNTYTQWNVVLTDNFGNTINGGSLSLTSYPSGPHPYQSDFYYASSIPSLPTGRQWAAGLVNQ
ncbi:MAG: hypothetical protein ACREJX_20160, partial [Polyangiaceae bacterium]